MELVKARLSDSDNAITERRFALPLVFGSAPFLSFYPCTSSVCSPVQRPNRIQKYRFHGKIRPTRAQWQWFMDVDGKREARWIATRRKWRAALDFREKRSPTISPSQSRCGRWVPATTRPCLIWSFDLRLLIKHCVEISCRNEIRLKFEANRRIRTCYLLECPSRLFSSSLWKLISERSINNLQWEKISVSRIRFKKTPCVYLMALRMHFIRKLRDAIYHLRFNDRYVRELWRF